MLIDLEEQRYLETPKIETEPSPEGDAPAGDDDPQEQ